MSQINFCVALRYIFVGYLGQQPTLDNGNLDVGLI